MNFNPQVKFNSFCVAEIHGDSQFMMRQHQFISNIKATQGISKGGIFLFHSYASVSWMTIRNFVYRQSKKQKIEFCQF